MKPLASAPKDKTMPNEILRDNEHIELLRDHILRLEETGYLPKMDYATCQPVFVPRQEDSDVRPA